MAIKPVQLVALSILLIVMLLTVVSAEARTFKKPVTKKEIRNYAAGDSAASEQQNENICKPKFVKGKRATSNSCAAPVFEPQNLINSHTMPGPSTPQDSKLTFDSIVVLDTKDARKTKEAVNYIRDNGGAVSVVYIPDTLVTLKLPSNLESTLTSKYGAKFYRGKVDASIVSKVPALVNALSAKPKTAPSITHEERPFVDETMPRPKIMGRGAQPGTGYAPSPYGDPGSFTSDYMVGDVFVSVILPESNGAIDLNKEDWNSTEEASIDAAVAVALGWWVNRSIDYNVSYPLTFWMYPQHYKLPTSYEPMAHFIRRDDVSWVNESLNALGIPLAFIPSDIFRRSINYANFLRNNANITTDWAFTMYFIDGSNDVWTGGYAYLGGPYLVVDANYYFDHTEYAAGYITHEMGHIFWALDQYYDERQPRSCNEKSGILQVENQNAQQTKEGSGGGCLINEPSIMRNRSLDAGLDRYAAGQIGWQDLNANGVTDSIDYQYNPSDNDTDSDGVINYWDLDDDNDGVEDKDVVCNLSPGKRGCIEVTKAGTGSGKIVSDPAGINCVTRCSVGFKSGTVVTLTATPGADGSTFAGWGGDCSGTSPTCTLPVEKAKKVTANFNGPEGTHNLAIEKLGGGKGYVLSDPSGISCNGIGDCSLNFKKGWWLTLYAGAEKGSVFDGWSSCSGKGPCTVVVDSAKVVKATFSLAPPTYNLTVTKTENGVVSSDKDREALEGAVNCGAAVCTAAYKNLTSVILYATPNQGSAFIGWSGACSGTRAFCTLVIDSNKAVTANFVKNQQ